MMLTVVSHPIPELLSSLLQDYLDAWRRQAKQLLAARRASTNGSTGGGGGGDAAASKLRRRRRRRLSIHDFSGSSPALARKKYIYYIMDSWDMWRVERKRARAAFFLLQNVILLP